MKKTIMAMGFVLAIIIIILYYGWAVSILWNWFIAPLGFPFINWANAYGILMVSVLFRNTSINTSLNDNEKIEQIFIIIFKPIMLLMLGWIVKSNFL